VTDPSRFVSGRPEIVTCTGPADLAATVAHRLLARLAAVQTQRGEATLVLTGGTISTAVYQAVCSDPAAQAVDWGRVDLWWGDERFLPSGHPDRNETQARTALLSALPLDPARVHPMPASDGPDGDDPEAAARRYAGELAAAARRPAADLPRPPEPRPPAGAASSFDVLPSEVPRFDVLLLGLGPDAHVASLFPGQVMPDESRLVVPVFGSPKPPPVRISLTLPVINTATEIWLVVAGASKADAVRRALAGEDVPAANLAADRTTWLLDTAATP
jgi:6-phosphogluconolactonase